ncbi:MAG: isoleucyl-tRNA synthetase, partial [Amphiamblys sp. WSBS2006]
SPPFATGLPHYGHILAGTIKDTVLRYIQQRGYAVDSRFGWDCHGLPIEHEIDKKLGMSGKDAVEKIGMEAYNSECRKIVLRCRDDWEKTTERIGRWIDYKNDYKTMDKDFMESVWWAFKTLYGKGLVYSGIRVMPYSTACATPLSNFEVAMNYKEALDYSIVVKFPLADDPATFLLAWTTTPWTLPSNLALCVNPEMTYVYAACGGETYVFEESRLGYVAKELGAELVPADQKTGKKLAGLRYTPVFGFFSQQGAHRVIADSYVEAGTGTGIVHQAPGFGEDDLRCCVKNGIVTIENTPCPLDPHGFFVEPVSDYAGCFYKDTEKTIVKTLQERGLLVSARKELHSTPHCWRSDTPLIYRAVSSWFVRVEEHT